MLKSAQKCSKVLNKTPQLQNSKTPKTPKPQNPKTPKPQSELSKFPNKLNELDFETAFNFGERKTKRFGERIVDRATAEQLVFQRFKNGNEAVRPARDYKLTTLQPRR